VAEDGPLIRANRAAAPDAMRQAAGRLMASV
jgi:hypothetical protein